MQPYLGKQEEEQLLQVAQWDKKFSAVLQHLGVLLERLGCIKSFAWYFYDEQFQNLDIGTS